MKVDVGRFGCNNLLQDFKVIKNVKISIDVWWKIFSSAISPTIHRYFNIFPDFKFLKKLLQPKRSTSIFHNKLIKFVLFFFYFSIIYIYIYIYTYIYIYLYIYTYIYVGKTGNKFDCRKIYLEENHKVFRSWLCILNYLPTPNVSDFKLSSGRVSY